MSQRTALYDEHVKAQADMVEVDDWLLPLHYGSAMDEHNKVRQAAGMIDLSCSGVIDIKGSGSKDLLRSILVYDVEELKIPGKTTFSSLCNEDGGIVAHVFVYFLSSDFYRMIVSPRGTYALFTWLNKHKEKHSVVFTKHTDLSLISVQGPHVMSKIKDALNPSLDKMVQGLKKNDCVECFGWMVSRTGFTGEDGILIVLPSIEAVGCWQKLLAQNIAPIGFAARDTLRLEAGHKRFGIDFDEKSTPLEVGFDKEVSWEPSDRDFIGRSALEKQRRAGATHELVGIKLDDRGIMRHGQHVFVGDVEKGQVTSGVFSPTLQRSIAFVRVESPSQAKYLVEIRNKMQEASVAKLPFVKLNKAGGLL